MTTPTSNWDLLTWLDEHKERGRLLKDEGRETTNRVTAKKWHEQEVDWRDELVAMVKPLHPSWAEDLLYLDDNYERGRGEEKNLKYKEEKFVESAQFHAARLYTLRDFRGWLRDKAVRPKPKRKRGRPPGQMPYRERATGWAAEIDRHGPDVTKTEVAEGIAKRENLDIATVEREARRMRAKGKKEKTP